MKTLFHALRSLCSVAPKTMPRPRKGTHDAPSRRSSRVPLAVEALEERALLDAGDILATALPTGLGPMSGTFRTSELIGDGLFGVRDVDLYAFQAAAGTTLTAWTSYPLGGLPMDTVVRLFDAFGNQLALNDDSNGTLYSQLRVTIPATGTYYIGVSGYPNTAYSPLLAGSNLGGDVGSYNLDLNLDVGDTLGTALQTGVGPLAGGFSNTTTIGTGFHGSRDVDIYRFTAAAGTVLTAQTSYPLGGVPMDTMLRLIDAVGNTLLVSDDSVGSLYSQINVVVPATGTYYLAVSGAPNAFYSPLIGGSGLSGDTGSYRIDLSVTSADIGDSILTAFNTGVGPIAGHFHTSTVIGDGIYGGRDVDFYRISVAAGTVLTVRTSYPGGVPLDTVVRLFDAFGNLLAANDDRVIGDSYSGFTYVFTVPGTYYIAVSGFANFLYNPFLGGSGVNGSVGSYRLDIDLAPLLLG